MTNQKTQMVALALLLVLLSGCAIFDGIKNQLKSIVKGIEQGVTTATTATNAPAANP